MAHENGDADLVWKMIERVKTCMMVTHEGDALDGRPFTAFPDREAGKLYFMTGAQGDAVRQLEADRRVFLSFADKGGHDYVTIDGDAVVRDDRAKVRELWNPWAQAFFDGPDDPSIRIVEVTPEHARYWDSPNSVATTIAMLGGLVTGRRPDVGKEGETQL